MPGTTDNDDRPRPPAASNTPRDAPAYELRLTQTRDATGYFMPVPSDEPGFETVWAYLGAHPYDEFMHRYGLQQVLSMPPETVRRLVEPAAGDHVLAALLLEAATLHTPLAAVADQLPAAAALRHLTPLIILRAECLADREKHRQWTRLLKDNLLHHQCPAETGDAWPPPLFPAKPRSKTVALDDLGRPPTVAVQPDETPPFESIYTHATEALNALGILEAEQRHESALSPIGLLRRWRLAVRVEQDRHRFRLRGLQTAYGKGLSLERARASCAMEIVERVSAFASVVNGRLPDTAAGTCLERARLSDLRHNGISALDPDAVALEVPYEDQPLYWIAAESAGTADGRTVMIPFQCAYLFANLDEVCLFSGLGSTGLAAGSTMAQAKFHALLECLERDAEAVQPFDPRQCFRLATRDPAVGGLLDAYRRRGIDLFFQDCSRGFGVPCYQCFVYGPGPDAIAKGTSTHFTGWQAALAAMTETPYPFPHGPASRPGPEALPVRLLEDLPDYSAGRPATDLHRLESLLAANDLYPIYVNLTRRDIGIPVVRALVPGLELMADFDRYARVSPRLYHNYRQLAGGRGHDAR